MIQLGNEHPGTVPLQVFRKSLLFIQLRQGPVSLQLQFIESVLHNYISLLHKLI